MIQVNIKKKIKDFYLDINFRSSTKRIGILGASGAGKSMVLKILAGLVRADEGEIVLDGETLYSSQKKIFQRPQDRRVGYLFQNYALFPHLTVRENLSIVEKDSKKVDGLIEAFQLKGLEKKMATKISGGQQQRLALARLMARQNRVLLFDEPFSALDFHLKEEMKIEVSDILKNFQGHSFMVSHSNIELYEFTDELLVMDTGKIILQAQTREIFKNPRKLKVAKLLGVENIIQGKELGKRGGFVGVYAKDLRLGKGEVNFKVKIKNKIYRPYSITYLTHEGLKFRSEEDIEIGRNVYIHSEQDKMFVLSE